mmetsp:Transcript_24524/g.60613  ORF Transcript_24524/g.60613 Transcript_24524/m.60613 type:complete len:138 (-) Transcript_24524:1263-1676(-)
MQELPPPAIHSVALFLPFDVLLPFRRLTRDHRTNTGRTCLWERYQHVAGQKAKTTTLIRLENRHSNAIQVEGNEADGVVMYYLRGLFVFEKSGSFDRWERFLTLAFIAGCVKGIVKGGLPLPIQDEPLPAWAAGGPS